MEGALATWMKSNNIECEFYAKPGLLLMMQLMSTWGSILENKTYEQDMSKADQRFCFRYTDSVLNPKFPASSHLECLYSSVCVRPVRKTHCWFSHEVAHIVCKVLPSLCCFHKQNSFLGSSGYLVPRKHQMYFCPDMTLKLLTGTLSITKHASKQINKTEVTLLYYAMLFVLLQWRHFT